MDKKWQKRACLFLERSLAGSWALQALSRGWARPVLGAAAGAGGLLDASPVRIRAHVRRAPRRSCAGAPWHHLIAWLRLLSIDLQEMNERKVVDWRTRQCEYEIFADLTLHESVDRWNVDCMPE
eukprot:COSAG03_NODE_2068_length_3159_cov_1.488889_2_plen_124_part_00